MPFHEKLMAWILTICVEKELTFNQVDCIGFLEAHDKICEWVSLSEKPKSSFSSNQAECSFSQILHQVFWMMFLRKTRKFMTSNLIKPIIQFVKIETHIFEKWMGAIFNSPNLTENLCLQVETQQMMKWKTEEQGALNKNLTWSYNSQRGVYIIVVCFWNISVLDINASEQWTFFFAFLLMDVE